MSHYLNRMSSVTQAVYSDTLMNTPVMDKESEQVPDISRTHHASVVWAAVFCGVLRAGMSGSAIVIQHAYPMYVESSVSGFVEKLSPRRRSTDTGTYSLRIFRSISS